IPALFQSMAEATHVLYSMHSTLEAEARERGYQFLANGPIGTEALFSRQPVASMAELQKLRVWRWGADSEAMALNSEMGEHLIPASVGAVAGLFKSGGIDAAWAVGPAAVVWEWTLRAPYVYRLPAGYLFGCIVVSSRAFADLSPEDQRQVTEAAVRL